MMLLLSGEGATDLGSCNNSLPTCSLPQFNVGPLAVMVDQLMQGTLGYSIIQNTPNNVKYVHKSSISKTNNVPKGLKLRIHGSKTTKDTGYFEENARRLGLLAKKMSQRLDMPVIAVLFRDADGTNTSSRSLWQDKFNSMCRGFKLSEHPHCVPMLPQPKSEAWLLCALQATPYQHCQNMEQLSGNDASPNSPKKQLSAAVNSHPSAVQLVQWVQNGRINVHQIKMMSFNWFRDQLLYVLSLIYMPPIPNPHCQ